MQTDLQHLFEGANQGSFDSFITRLDQKPNAIILTELEKQISILLWMNFDHYEIAQLLNIEVADVEMERERIREKLVLNENETIQKYLHSQLS